MLAPWPNRIRDGRYAFAGREHRAAITEPERGTALHGLVPGSTGARCAAPSTSVTLGHELHPQPGYPFSLGLQSSTG